MDNPQTISANGEKDSDATALVVKHGLVRIENSLVNFTSPIHLALSKKPSFSTINLISYSMLTCYGRK